MPRNTVLICMLEFFGCFAFAFDASNCREGITRLNLEYGGMVSPFIISGESFSSTGECAAFGFDSRKGKIMNFIVSKSDSIQNDLSRKNGEALSTLQHLAGLSSEQMQVFAFSSEARKVLSSREYDHFYELLLRL